MSIEKVLRRQRALRFMVIGGMASVLLSFPVFFLGGAAASGTYMATGQNMMAGVWLSVLMFLGGAATLGYGLVKGAAYRDGATNKEATGVIIGAYIIGRYVVNSANEISSETELLDDLPYKFMVRVALPDGRRIEMQTARECYFTIPEAAVGRIQHQGTWITRFEMTPVEERPYYKPQV